jgi:hypothetical protein
MHTKEFEVQRFNTPGFIRKLISLDAMSMESYRQDPPGEGPCILNIV